MPALTAWRYMEPMATCSISSCRTDPITVQNEYGGSIENRARLMLEVADAVVSVWGAKRVGMHLARAAIRTTCMISNPPATFGYVARELGRRGLGFLFAREFFGPDRLDRTQEQFGGVYIANEKYTLAEANRVIQEGEADAVAFGRLFIANPICRHGLRAMHRSMCRTQAHSLHRAGTAIQTTLR